jgi:hypothetical protein
MAGPAADETRWEPTKEKGMRMHAMQHRLKPKKSLNGQAHDDLRGDGREETRLG